MFGGISIFKFFFLFFYSEPDLPDLSGLCSGMVEASTHNKLVITFKAQPPSVSPGPPCKSGIEYTAFHQYELWVNIFYIITDIESIDILIKGSKYWVGAPTAHQLSLPQEVDSHNPCEE